MLLMVVVVALVKVTRTETGQSQRVALPLIWAQNSIHTLTHPTATTLNESKRVVVTMKKSRMKVLGTHTERRGKQEAERGRKGGAGKREKRYRVIGRGRGLERAHEMGAVQGQMVFAPVAAKTAGTTKDVVTTTVTTVVTTIELNPEAFCAAP